MGKPATHPSAEFVRMVAEAVFAMINAQPGGLAQPPIPEVAPVPVVAVNTIVEPVVVIEQSAELQMRCKELKHFLSFNPPTFSGTESPIEAFEWLSSVKRTLTLAVATEDKLVSLATFLLTREARVWWEEEMLRKFGGRQITQISIADFSESFLQMFIPPIRHVALQDQFLGLKQGELTVDEYLHKFISLSPYVMPLWEDEDLKTKKFYEGLRDDLRLLLVGPMLFGFHVLIKTARSVERDLERVQSKSRVVNEKSELKVPTPLVGSGYRKNKRKCRLKEPTPSKVSGAMVPRAPLICFTCRKVGHKSNRCRSCTRKTKTKKDWSPFGNSS